MCWLTGEGGVVVWLDVPSLDTVHGAGSYTSQHKLSLRSNCNFNVVHENEVLYMILHDQNHVTTFGVTGLCNFLNGHSLHSHHRARL